VFPNGTSDPIYVSDWEWMFEIFTRAMEDLCIKDGYCISVYFKGYSEAGGNFDSAFGGGCPLWYRNQDGDAAFGGDTEAMRTYLQMMNNWYKKGWLDKNFAEHTSDQIYAIDSAKINSGKIGAFVGRRGNAGGQMDNDDKFTDGIMIFGARPAINDVYGVDAVKNKEPYSLYQYSLLRANICISKKASEEELKTILTMLDYLYTEQGGTLLAFGLTKEEFETTNDPHLHQVWPYKRRSQQNRGGGWKHNLQPRPESDQGQQSRFRNGCQETYLRLLLQRLRACTEQKLRCLLPQVHG
jgi:hypothetical protein